MILLTSVSFTMFFGGGVHKTAYDNFISADSVKKAAKRIHKAGGCDATDDYGRRYDDAVTLVLDILPEGTGYVIEDIIDHGEDRGLKPVPIYDTEDLKQCCETEEYIMGVLP